LQNGHEDHHAKVCLGILIGIRLALEEVPEPCSLVRYTIGPLVDDPKVRVDIHRRDARKAHRAREIGHRDEEPLQI
jgi:hypothetical protein